MVLPRGAKVHLCGLQKRKDLNGEVAEVREFVESAGRYAIVVSRTGEQIRAKSENFMACANSACGRMDSVKFFACGRCKRVSYCGKECQKVDWKKHKPECKSDANSGWQLRVPKDAACSICLERDSLLIQLGCACRGNQAWGHLKCRIEHAESKYDPRLYYRCFTCNQNYGTDVRHMLAKAYLKRFESWDRNSEESIGAYNNMASTYMHQKKFTEAKRILTELYMISKTSLGEDNIDTLGVGNNLGHCMVHTGEIEKGTLLLKQILDCKTRTLGAENASTLRTVVLYAHALFSERAGSTLEESRIQLEEALQLLKENYDIAVDSLGESHSTTLNIEENMAYIHDRIEHRKLDLAYLRNEIYHPSYGTFTRGETSKRYNALYGSDNAKVMDIKESSAQSLLMAKRFEEAESLIREVVVSRIKNQGTENPKTVGATTTLCAALNQVGKFAEAKELGNKNLIVAQRIHANDKHKHAEMRILGILAESYQRAGELEDALLIYMRMKVFYKDWKNPFPLEIANTHIGELVGKLHALDPENARSKIEKIKRNAGKFDQ